MSASLSSVCSTSIPVSRLPSMWPRCPSAVPCAIQAARP